MSDLAQRQIAELAEVSDGAVQLLSVEHDDKGTTTLTISLDTSGIGTVGDGIRLRGRERFEILIEGAYPYRHPDVYVMHRRWAGTPHVQWGRLLCLYAAPAVEWNPADGMRGLVARLNLWLQRAAAGQLDPAGQPLHPPVAYASYKHGCVVVRPDVGNLAPWTVSQREATELHYAWCAKQGNRVDVLEWLTKQQVYDQFVAGELPASDEQSRALFIAPFVLISDPLDMEYPSTAKDLAAALDLHGFPRDQLIRGLVNARTINKAIGATVEGHDEIPAMMLLGTPARRLVPGQPLAHITAWHLDELGGQITDLLEDIQPEHVELAARVRKLADDWLDIAKVQWMVIHEARAEVTVRRDTGSPSQWLHGKRVLVLGCGALGAPIAEQCARSGVTRLHVVDKSVVNPGIIVRQPYDDADIGFSKADRLAQRLSRIRRDLTVTSAHENIVTVTLQGPQFAGEYDLIVDATADIGVRTRLEYVRATGRDSWPPTINALFGHTAQRGVATVSMPGATGSSHDILRRLAIDTAARPAAGWSAISQDLFPNPPRTERFFPEPGCSAPTFTGSATDVTALASGLFSAAIAVASDPGAAPMTAIGQDITADATGPRPQPLIWQNDLTLADQSGRYEVRISSRAMTEMRTEARRGRRVRGSRIETGGMVLGSMDESIQTIYIDTAAGPSPDSRLSAAYFNHGIQGTQDIVAAARASSVNRVGFVGMWHTHPGGRAAPSEIDETGMSDIVAPDGTGRRAVMLILGGSSSAWTSWLETGAPPDVYVRVVDRTAEAERRAPIELVTRGADRWYPGGYAYPERTQSHDEMVDPQESTR